MPLSHRTPVSLPVGLPLPTLLNYKNVSGRLKSGRLDKGTETRERKGTSNVATQSLLRVLLLVLVVSSPFSESAHTNQTTRDRSARTTSKHRSIDAMAALGRRLALSHGASAGGALVRPGRDAIAQPLFHVVGVVASAPSPLRSHGPGAGAVAGARRGLTQQTTAAALARQQLMRPVWDATAAASRTISGPFAPLLPLDSLAGFLLFPKCKRSWLSHTRGHCGLLACEPLARRRQN